MSDTDRARERLDFEAAAEAIEKGEWKTESTLPSSQKVMEFIGGDNRFVSSSKVEVTSYIALFYLTLVFFVYISNYGLQRCLNDSKQRHQTSGFEEKMIDKIYPKREEFQWRPSPLLCKRFDLIDPFMGKVL